MNFLRDIPIKWWAVIVGITFGSVALITINGAKEGYGRAAITAAGIAPLLCLVAGALLPKETPLEMAALVGGITALGGTALVLNLAKHAPLILGSAAEAAAKSFLDLRDDTATRIRQDGTPAESDPQADALIEKIDEQDRDGGYH